MRLQLQYQPIPENAPKFADDIVEAALEISSIELDYSVASLHDVDAIIEGMRQDGCTVAQIAETLFGVGCYVGEVFVRQAGARWRNTADTAIANFTGFPLVVQLGEKNFCNPIDKVFKRLENGEEDSLAYFFTVFTELR